MSITQRDIALRHTPFANRIKREYHEWPLYSNAVYMHSYTQPPSRPTWTASGPPSLDLMGRIETIRQPYRTFEVTHSVSAEARLQAPESLEYAAYEMYRLIREAEEETILWGMNEHVGMLTRAWSHGYIDALREPLHPLPFARVLEIDALLEYYEELGIDEPTEFVVHPNTYRLIAGVMLRADDVSLPREPDAFHIRIHNKYGPDAKVTENPEYHMVVRIPTLPIWASRRRRGLLVQPSGAFAYAGYRSYKPIPFTPHPMMPEGVLLAYTEASQESYGEVPLVLHSYGYNCETLPVTSAYLTGLRIAGGMAVHYLRPYNLALLTGIKA